MAHPMAPSNHRLDRRLAALAMATATVLSCAGFNPGACADEAAGSDPLRGPVIQKQQAPPADTHALKKATARRIKTDIFIAYKMAKDPWIDKMALADPSIVEAICGHPGPARVLAKHRRIAEVAEADHYLCRRLTRWNGATYALIRNRRADKVIQLDPEGIYRAINRDPKVARLLAKHMMFNQMIVETPDLGRVVAEHF